MNTSLNAAAAAVAEDSVAERRGGMPPQVPYIIGNEGCERFSFYGMRNILTAFLVSSVILAYIPEAQRAGEAKDVFHTFVIGVYFFPLLGGWLADRFFGKYNTVLWMSLVYCLGHACLAMFDQNRNGFYTGLFLIALGAGGIKPLVASFVGDQFDRTNKHLAKIVFDAFYWIINFGSFFASLLMPLFLKNYGASVAFGIPGALMLVATVIFWMARAQYVRVPPSPPDPNSFLRVVRTALFKPAAGPAVGTLVAGVGVLLAMASISAYATLGVVAALCLALVCVLAFGGAGAWLQLDRAYAVHPAAAVDGVRAVLRLLIVFALVTPFWSLFDQKASTWVLQGEQMVKPEWFSSSQMQALNPALVMILIPFNNLILYPALRRWGFEPTPLRRMGWGIAFAGFAWIAAGVIQLGIDAGTGVTITWQILPYALLTLGEVLVSATGLEFAYSQAPPPMKGAIMSFWNLSVTIGSLWVLLANAAVRNPTVIGQITSTGLSEVAFLMFFFAGFALVVALLFGLYARHYPMQDHYRAE